MMYNYDVCVIGGGAAGMSAAIGAIENGAEKVLLLERDIELGGILQQCIHNGFGLHTFNEELTGPAFTEKLKEKLLSTKVEIKLATTVLKITNEKLVHYMNSYEGYQIIKARTIVVSVGCRERTSHQIEVPGKRLAGIMTAGVAQRYLNIDGYLVGKKIFILGSGDIGLIMARRMTLEGAKVLGVAEIMPYSNGLNRNLVQCLNDFDIPLYLSHTVTMVKGNERLEEVIIKQVDHHLNPIEGTEKSFFVDTLLLSVGLIPENGLLRDIGIEINPITSGAVVDDYYQTSIKGIYACGNSLHVHDLVDFASLEGYITGKNAASFDRNYKADSVVNVIPTNQVRYCLPNKINLDNPNLEVEIKLRVSKPIEKGKIIVKSGDRVIKSLNRSHLVPSEMEIIRINKGSINQCDQHLSIEVI